MNSERKIFADPIIGLRIAGGRIAGRSEAEHFYRCDQCGGWVDKRDLDDVFSHEVVPHDKPPQPH